MILSIPLPSTGEGAVCPSKIVGAIKAYILSTIFWSKKEPSNVPPDSIKISKQPISPRCSNTSLGSIFANFELL